MKRVTRNNLIKLVELKKQYIESQDDNILKEINEYVNNVINKDKTYYTKLSSYNFEEETIRYLI